MRPIVFLFILFAILIKPQLSLAEDIFLYFGGGSPIIKDDTMFDYSAKNIISYLKKHPNWKSKLYYRAGALEGFSKNEQAQLTTINAYSFNEEINGLIKKINSSKKSNSNQKSKDKIVIYIGTHGVAPFSPEHTGDKDGLNFSIDGRTIDASKLKDLARVAKDKNVKIAIIGTTCYSGSLIDLENKNVCVISSSKPENIGFETFDGFFTDKMSKKNQPQSIEDIYLAARSTNVNELDKIFFWSYKSEALPHQPIISTPAGLAVDKILSPLTFSIVGYNDDIYNQLNKSCIENQEGLDKLYKEIQGLQKKVSYSIMGLTYDIEIKKISDTLKSKIAKFNKVYEDIKLNTKRPYGASNYSDKNVDQKKLEKLISISREITTDERLLYQQLYKKIKAKTSGSNACQDFML